MQFSLIWRHFSSQTSFKTINPDLHQMQIRTNMATLRQYSIRYRPAIDSASFLSAAWCRTALKMT